MMNTTLAALAALALAAASSTASAQVAGDYDFGSTLCAVPIGSPDNCGAAIDLDADGSYAGGSFYWAPQGVPLASSTLLGLAVYVMVGGTTEVYGLGTPAELYGVVHAACWKQVPDAGQLQGCLFLGRLDA